jgi:hypothetical protein
MTRNVNTAVTHTVMKPERADQLLRHCLTLGELGERRVPAQVRLEQALGPELARMLLASLTAHSRR